MLKAKHPKGYYKSELKWLKAVYRNNKELLDRTFANQYTTAYKAFKATVMEYRKDRYTKQKYNIPKKKDATIMQAVERLSNSEIVKEKSQRIHENALTALRKDKLALQAVRVLTGWKDKIDPSKLSWSSEEKMYVYKGSKGSVLIEFTVSPVSIKLYKKYANPRTNKLENISVDYSQSLGDEFDE